MGIYRKKTALAAAVAAISGLSVPAMAVETSSATQNEQLETVVVVGQATNALISTEDLEAYQANDLADVFRLTPSINVGGSLGIAQKIYVRGLEDNYINVTVDGAPQTSTLFHHIGRVAIDPALLQEVEVQAGAGEATSGAGAIGGAIRFKTKDVNDLLDQNEAFGGSVKGNYFSNDGEQYSVSFYGRLTDNWGLVAYYSDTDRDNFEDGDGDEVLGTASDQNLSFIKLSGNISDNQTLAFSYEGRDEEADFSKNPNWHVPAGAPLYASEAKRDTYIVNYTLQHNDFLNLEATLYDTEQSFKGGAYNWLAEITSVGFDIRNTTLLGDHKIIYGVDYRDDDVKSDGVWAETRITAEEEGSVLGAYAQVHSPLSDQLLLSYGARYDNYENAQVVQSGQTGTPSKFDESDVSLNIGVSYELTEAWTLGLGYAEAFRGKEIGDGFTFGDSPIGGAMDENLDGESVSNIEVSAEYSGQNLNAKIAVYQSDIDDVIVDIPDRGGVYYQNIGTLETQGFEASLTYQLNDFELYAGFAAVDTEINYGTFSITDGSRTTREISDLATSDVNGYEHKGLGNSVGDTWNIGLNYTPRADLQFGLNVAYVENLKIDTLYVDEVVWGTAPYALKKESYTTVDLFAEWQATQQLSLGLAVTNLFDKHYREHASVGDFTEVSGYGSVAGPWEAGRDIRFTANFEF